jgi:hypothetical protein
MDVINEEILHRHMWRYPELSPIRSPERNSIVLRIPQIAEATSEKAQESVI